MEGLVTHQAASSLDLLAHTSINYLLAHSSVAAAAGMRFLSSAAVVLAVAMVVVATAGRAGSVAAADDGKQADCSRTQEVVDYCAKAFGEVKKTGDLRKDAIQNAHAFSECCRKAQAEPFQCGCAIRRALAANRTGGNFAEAGCLSRYICSDNQ
ncbi:hypothetical protein BS78_09G044000 [Paspalum vaginatum]|nr:hypothetical protein BS78_09G044000 [Paspalum vaginatum]